MNDYVHNDYDDHACACTCYAMLTHITLWVIFKQFWLRMSLTWGLVLVENLMQALMPLFIGYAIDGLLEGRLDDLFILTIIFLVWEVVAVIRRFYDTRTYGDIRVWLGMKINEKHQNLPVSTQNARLDMSRELVDFLEEGMPGLLTAVVQMVVVLCVLYIFHTWLGYSVIAISILTILVYALFHKRFFNLNRALNLQTEQQVRILEMKKRPKLLAHLTQLRRSEVQISDTEAISFGLIFMLQALFIITNLWVAAQIPNVTAGKIFSIVSYSWEYVEAAIILPMALQNLSRLQEITHRINKLDA